MAEIGRSDLLIVPKFESKLSDTINKELGVASKCASNTGRTRTQTVQGFSGGFAQALGAVSSIVNRAMASIQDHVGAGFAFRYVDALSLHNAVFRLPRKSQRRD